MASGKQTNKKACRQAILYFFGKKKKNWKIISSTLPSPSMSSAITVKYCSTEKNYSFFHIFIHEDI